MVINVWNLFFLSKNRKEWVPVASFYQSIGIKRILKVETAVKRFAK
jgi:hypothetical protein